ncbi:MAG: extracellular solute-binding protein, partial [Coriobacteriales bacterium]|nr:extracellular solute-binding protein [Coriobacteriales bacterium]
MKKWSKVYTGFILFFLFAPIVVMMVFSFNEARSLSVMGGFSTYWYRELFRDGEALRALRNTLILALSAATISTIMGTAASVGINRLRSKAARFTVDTVTNIPMMNPDIITGVSLMLMFVFVGRLFGAATSLNFWTMLCAHITFCLPYVILQVLPKLQQMDASLPEAAMDLGCTPLRAFLKVTLPEIMPGIATGLIMAFALSLDDFVISYFTVGNGFQTLPIFIYSMTKKTVTPEMYALATLIFFVILALLIFSNLAGDDDDQEDVVAAQRRHAKSMERAARRGERRERFESSGRRGKGILWGATGILAVAVIALVAVSIGAGNVRTLNVYNWGEYISDGGDDSLDTIRAFEEWYEEEYGEKVKVNYSTYTSNEDMYAKLSSGAVSYDVIFPSDYMISRMANEGMLLPLDFSNIPNYQYIGEDYRGLYYDPDDRYSVPYTYGVVGIIYNANVVDEADTGDWDLMWNPKYKGQILQFNNSRDAFATAQYKLGIDVNSNDPADWDRALAELQKQQPLVKSYVMDEIYNMMESGEAAIGAYYAGDYFTMLDAAADNVDLRFYYPREHQLLRGRHVHPQLLPGQGARGDLHQLHA